MPHGFGIGSGIHVSAEKIGSPVDGVRSPSGIPKIDGVLPGASGAQFIGKLIHEPHPNPQESPSARFWAMSPISLADWDESPISSTLPPPETSVLITFLESEDRVAPFPILV